MKRKLVVFLSILIILFLIYIFFSFKAKNYTLKYKIKSFEVTENFNKKNKIYKFIIKKDDNTFVVEVNNKYIRKRKLVEKINYKNNCITVHFKNFDSQSICLNNGDYYTKYYESDFSYETKDTYENIHVYNYIDNPILIWNYNEFIYLNNKTFSKIKLFKEDKYSLDIITKYKKYLLVADYDSKYTFNKMYLINSKNGKVEDVSLEKDVYFDSYILGTYKKYIYLYDTKAKKEYIINPLKNYIEKTDKGIYKNNEFISLTDNKLSKKTYYFTEEKDFYFTLKDNNLIYITPSTSVNITNLTVQNIIYENKDICYFISDDKLYFVKYNEKIIPIMSYSEWEFNNKNIYIF